MSEAKQIVVQLRDLRDGLMRNLVARAIANSADAAAIAKDIRRIASETHMDHLPRETQQQELVANIFGDLQRILDAEVLSLLDRIEGHLALDAAEPDRPGSRRS